MSLITARLTIGLLQGFILSSLVFANKSATVAPAILLPLFLVALFVPTLLIQSLGKMQSKNRWRWAIFAAIILAAIGNYAIFRQATPLKPLFEYPELFASTSVALFIAHTLILSGDSDHRFKASYSTYFSTAWKMGMQVAFAFGFTVVFWAMLWLGANLFKIIHLNFFETLITNHWFAFPAIALATALALHITDIKASLIHGMRNMVLVLLSWLLPVMVIIISLFLLCLTVTGPEPLWQTGHAADLLVCAAAVLITLINATYQEGQSNIPAIQRYSAVLACVLLTPVILLAIYALSLRVEQYGWTASRIYGAVIMLVIAAYAVGYLVTSLVTLLTASFKSNKQLNTLEITNIAASWLMLAAYLALTTPVADPARLMVASQIARLHSGQVTPEQFDFAALRYKGARYGTAALHDLANHWEGASVEYVKAQANAALALNPNSYFGQKNSLSVETKKRLIVVRTQDVQLPESFVSQIWGWSDGAVPLPNCLNVGSQKCDAWIVSSQQKSPMVLMLGDAGFIGFMQNVEGRWSAIGTWPISPKCKDKKFDAQEGKFSLVTPVPVQPDIDINGWRVHFEPNRSPVSCQVLADDATQR